MPTYDDLRAHFDNSEPLTNLARRAAEVPIVRGFTLDLNPIWALFCDVEDGLIPRTAADYSFIAEFHPLSAVWHDATLFPPRFQGYRRRDLKREPKLWKDMGLPGHPRLGPVVMTIVYGPLRAPTVGSEADDDEVNLQRLMALLRESGAPARIEERPRARLAFSSGDRIITGQRKSGTYGGTLIDPAGVRYGMTCAHVAAKGEDIDDTAGAKIGVCAVNTHLWPLPTGKVCDPVVLPAPSPVPSNGKLVNMLDLALIDLAATPSPITLGGVAATLTSGQNVIIRGANGHIHCKLGSLAMSYAFQGGSQDYCFKDTIELKPQPLIPVGGAIGQLFTKMPTQGDSGAWVLTHDIAPIWAGVFFAEDGNRGFCIRANWAHAWAEKQLGKKLSV